MGREIERILLSRGHEISLVVDVANAASLDAEHLRGVDVALEFTTPATACDNIRRCLECGVAVVCGTTGWTEHLTEIKDFCRKCGGAFFYASNYSIGVNLMFRINRMLAGMMNRFGQYDVRIEETHHVHKKDAPSGTAITLAEGIIDNLDRKRAWVGCPTAAEDEIPVISYREGEVPGIHTVTYSSPDEVVTLSHSILDRRTLAAGAVAAAEFLCGRTGVYGMDDLLQ